MSCVQHLSKGFQSSFFYSATVYFFLLTLCNLVGPAPCLVQIAINFQLGQRDVQHYPEEDVEQEWFNDAALMEVLLDGEQLREIAIARAHPSLHAIVELSDGREYGGRNATLLQNVPRKVSSKRNLSCGRRSTCKAISPAFG